MRAVLTLRRSPLSLPTPSLSVPAAPSRSRAGCSCSTVFDPSYAQLAGVHRIQRVPETEKRGRRHSSEVTVVALDGSRGPAYQVDRTEIRVDFYRASGKGGQHRNKVESAVRLTHLPSGLVVTASEQRDKPQNLKVAWQRMEDALEARHREGAHRQVNGARAAQFGGSRSFTWTAWRNEVKSSDGRRAPMRQALKGRFGALLD